MLFLVLVCLFALRFLVVDDDGLLDFYRSFTSSLLRPSKQTASRLLSSPRPCLFFDFLCPLRCLCVFWCVVCCPLFWPLVVVVGLFLSDILILGCTCCQLTR